MSKENVITSGCNEITLGWVSNEINLCLIQARQYLEAYQEYGDADDLEECRNQTHQLRNTLIVINLYGASMLADELVAVLRFLQREKMSGKDDDILRAISAGIVSLQDYLERIEKGAPDVPVILLPVLNELRASRQKHLLSESAFFSPRLKEFLAKELAEPFEDKGELKRYLVSNRSNYHRGLLKWFHDSDVESGLASIRETLSGAAGAASKPVARIFALGSELVGVIRSHPEESSIATKLVIGQLDSIFRQIISSGEQTVRDNYPIERLRNLLFYIGRTRADSSEIRKLKEEYSLDSEMAYGKLAEGDSHIPSPGTVDAVREALNSDIMELKDALDIYNRSATKDSLILESLSPRLRQVADTVGMLGLGTYRQSLQDHLDVINGCLATGTEIEQDYLDALASDLLLVEMALPDLFYIPRGADQEEKAISGGEVQQYTRETLEEMLTEMARVKDIVSKSLKNNDREMLNEVPPLLGRLVGVMQILKMSAVSQLTNDISDYIKSTLKGSKSPIDNQDQIDKLADIISGIEYYLEVAPYQCKQETEILNYVEGSYAQLAVLEPASLAEETTAKSQTDSQDSVIPRPETDTESQPRQADAEKQVVDNNIIDDEIRSIFRQESEEQLETIAEFYPKWKKDHGNADALQTVRRAFHTLKGSGRTVGATVIGEFSWEIENLFNHIIDGVVQPTQPVLALIDKAIGFLPNLLNDDEKASSTERENIERQARRIVASVFEHPGEQQELQPQNETESQADYLLEGYALLNASIALMIECRKTPDQCRSTELRELFQDLYAKAETAGDEDGCALASQCNHQIASDKALSETIHSLIDTTAALQRNFDKEFSQLELSTSSESRVLTASGIESEQEKFLESIRYLAAYEALQAESDETTTDVKPQEIRTVAAESSQEFDEDLLPVFLEEARELNENIEGVFSRASDQEGFSPEAVVELKRLLHTLKGAARLTGNNKLGDVTHAFETMLIHSESDAKAGSPELFRRSRKAADYLHHQVDKLEKGESIEEADEILSLLSASQRVSRSGMEIEASRTEEVAETTASDTSDVLEKPVGPETETTYPPDGETASVTSDESKESDSVIGQSDIERDSQESSEEILEPESQKTEPEEKGRISAEIVAFPKRRRTTLRDDPNKRVRVSTSILDKLVDGVGEVITFGSRLQQQRNNISSNLSEFEQTLKRLREQLRSLEIEAETQILSNHQRDGDYPGEDGFDPLELDQYSAIQEHSRALAETISDLGNISTGFDQAQHEIDMLLSQHSRLTSDLQDVLLHTRTVPFSQHVARLTRLVRQTCASTGKRANLQITGQEEEMDRGILDRTIPLVEHLLRNAVYHGIELPEERVNADKNEQGTIQLSLAREGMEIVLSLSDDGKGFDKDAISRRAIQKGLISESDSLNNEDILRLATLPGFSTADNVDQISGRGVGLDVVVNEIENLGGRLSIESIESKGASFKIRFPFNIAITDALMIQQQGVWYAIPSASIDTVVRVTRNELDACYSGKREGYTYGSKLYRIKSISEYFDQEYIPASDSQKWHSLLLVSSGDRHIALHPEEMHGHNQIVLKSVGVQLESVPWIVGGTVRGDGSAALVIDPAALVSSEKQVVRPEPVKLEKPNVEEDEPGTVMVVDDSITMRKVTGSMLQRNGYNILTAKDGVDALAVIELTRPDIILLDIEMPRMDGFEFARHVRNNERYHDIPIIMVTSRTGDKHRERAMQLAIEAYMGKPFQEDELLDSIAELIGKRAGQA